MLTVLKPYEGEYSNFGVFDIENITYDKDGNISDKAGCAAKSAKEFKLGVIYVDGVYYDFTDKDEMLKMLLDKKYIGYRWYGHNVSYDLNGFFENILTIPESNILMNGGQFIELKLSNHATKNGIDKRNGNKTQKKNKNYIRFWDTYNLIPMKLKDIGAVFKLPKLAFNTSSFAYCRRDCEITHLIVEKYQSYCERFGIKPKLTTSSTAMSIFRTNFLKGNIWIDANDLYFKNSYIGGRTEVINKTLKHGHHYDVNSLYPAAMCENVYPNPSKIKKGVAGNFDYDLKNYEGVAFIKVKTADNIHIPILPYHEDGKIIYPAGTFKGWYNFNEIRFAVSRGYKILEVMEYYRAERMDSPFKDYVDYWYKAKSDCKGVDAGFYDFCKRMMNGLYGKFGEYHDSGTWGHISDDVRTKEEKDSGIDIFDLYMFDESNKGYGTWKKKGETLSEQITDHTIFSWCSYVTSYARIILYKHLESMGLDTISYMDTDSAFTTTLQESSDKLGEMKTEHNDIDCYFAAPKMYEIKQNFEFNDLIDYAIQKSLKHDEHKLKGVRLNGKDIFQKSYVQHRVIKSKEALRRGLEAGKWMTVIKAPHGHDTKRIWNPDGSSSPKVINIE